MASYDVSLFKKVKCSEDRADFINEVIPNMKWTPNEQAMDLGCGPGFATKNILWPLLEPHQVQSLTGIDIDESMIKECQTNCQIEGKVEYRQVNIEDRSTLPAEFKDRFSKSFSFWVLQDVYSLRSALKNVNWMMKEGGEIAFMLVAHSPQTPCHLEIFNESKWESFAPYVTQDCVNEIFCSADLPTAFRNLLEQCGFEAKSCYEFDKTREFQTADDYMDFYMGIDQNFNKIPKDLQQEFRQDMYEKFIKIPYVNRNTKEVRPVVGEDGVHLQHHQILNVHAVKVKRALL